MAYGEDFRKRAMAMLAEGKSATAVCRLLGVGYVTLHRWKKRQAEGSLAAAYPKRRKAYKINEEALKSYVAAHPDAYAEEIATAIGSRPGTVASALKRLKITRKKKRLSTESRTKKSEKIIFQK